MLTITALENARNARDDINTLALNLHQIHLHAGSTTEEVERQQKAITLAKDIRARCVDLIYDLTGVEVDR